MRSIHERDDAHNKKLKLSSERNPFECAFSLHRTAKECNRILLPRGFRLLNFLESRTPERVKPAPQRNDSPRTTGLPLFDLAVRQ